MSIGELGDDDSQSDKRKGDQGASAAKEVPESAGDISGKATHPWVEKRTLFRIFVLTLH